MSQLIPISITRPAPLVGGGDAETAVEELVVALVVGGEAIDEVVGINQAEDCGDGYFDAAAVVAPHDSAADLLSLGAEGGERGVIWRIGSVAEQTGRDRFDGAGDVEEQDAAVAEIAEFPVVASFLAHVDDGALAGELRHAADGTAVRNVGRIGADEVA